MPSGLPSLTHIPGVCILQRKTLGVRGVPILWITEELVIIGGEHHKTGQGGDTQIHYQNLLETARNTFQVKEVLYRWSTQDYTTMDQVPISAP